MIIKSIKIIANNICYGSAPSMEDEIEQHLSVSSSGRVWFSAKNYSQYLQETGFCRKKQLNIGAWKAQFLIGCLDRLKHEDYMTDCGTYVLEIRYNDNHIEKHSSSLCGDENALWVSRLMRRYIPVYSLWGISNSVTPDYEGKQAIFLFADKWIHFFQDKEKSDHIFAFDFGDECRALFFQMDCANEFIRLYPNCFDIEQNKIEETIYSITDIDLLGSAVFSQWRYLTHWSMGYSLDQKTSRWFYIMLCRMKELCKQKKTAMDQWHFGG